MMVLVVNGIVYSDPSGVNRSEPDGKYIRASWSEQRCCRRGTRFIPSSPRLMAMPPLFRDRAYFLVFLELGQFAKNIWIWGA